MSLSILFWILMLLWLFAGLSGWWKDENRNNWGLGGFFLTWFTIALLGWKVFGRPIQG